MTSINLTDSYRCRFVLDTDNWIIINADTNFQHIFQYSYMEITKNNSFSSYVHEQDYRPLIKSIKAQLSQGFRMISENFRITAKHGEVYRASFSGYILYENGTALMECILFNLNLLRNGENISANKISVKNNISVFENMPTGFLAASVLLNKDKKPYDIIIDYINAEACRLLCAQSDTVVGKKCFGDFGETDERVIDYFYKAAYEDKSFSIIEKNRLTGKYMHYYFYRIYDRCAGLIIIDADEEILMKRKLGILESYIKSVPDNLKTGIVQYLDDEYKTVVYANNAAYDMFGYNRDEFRDKFNNRLESILETASDLQKEKVKNLKLYEPSYSFETSIYTKTGGKRRFIENTMRLINSDGLEVLQSEFIDTEDITNNKNENELINRIVPYMMVKYHIKDKLYIISANDKFYDFFKIDKNSYDGNPMLRTHEDDMNVVSRAISAAAEGQDVDFVYRAVIDRNNERTFRVVGGCIGYKMGYPLYIMLFNDISDMKAVQDDAKYEKLKFNTFLKASKDIVFEYTVNSDTLKLYVNIPDGECSRAECIVYEKFSKNIYNSKLIHSEDAGKMLDIISGRKNENTQIRIKNIYNPDDDKIYIYSISGNMIKQRGVSDKFYGIMRKILRGSAILPSEEDITGAVLKKILSRCYCTICIDMQSGSYRHIRIKNSALRVTDFGDYDLDLLSYAKKYISRENVSDFIEMASRDGIKHMLESNSCYCSMFCIKRHGKTENKILEYTYIDERHDKVLLYILNINEFYRGTGMGLNINKDISFNFLMRISKDITRPLNMIISLINSAKNSAGANGQLAVYLDKINTCTISVSEFMTNIIDLVRLESGRFTAQNNIFLVKDLLNRINNSIAPAANRLNIGFEIAADKELDYAYIGDIVKINHIIMLLLTNSLRYAGNKGFIKINLSVKETEENVYKLIIEIRNNSENIPNSVLQNMFNIYEYSNDRHVNTEITLTIVKLTSEMLGGGIEFISGDGVTAVQVSVPVEVCSEEMASPINLIVHRNILIVNENIIYAERIISPIMEKDIGIDIAASSNDAVSLYMDSIDGYYDYIFVDMSMENNQGKNIIDKIRNSNRNDSGTVKIIAVIMDDEKFTAVNGADEVITKSDEAKKIKDISGI